jgi:hypothetical protein
MARDETVSQGSWGQDPIGKPREQAEDRPSLGELRLLIKALKTAVRPNMENRACGTGKREGSGKPRPLQSVEKLRSVNLVSAAEREPSRQGQARMKPPSGTNPEGGSSRAARPGEDWPDRTRCGDAKPQESHRERTQFTRRPVRKDSKGRPNARRDADPDERCPERTKGVSEPLGSRARRPMGESGRKAGRRHLPQSLKARLMPHEERTHD